ncbi:hypothetical protein B0H14DRAFT_2639483 [Mycena olivaceomarginata]|nr:hypothetical protein B0H14DRAFT_2639483 [Mycena olivaceomarginata]
MFQTPQGFSYALGLMGAGISIRTRLRRSSAPGLHYFWGCQLPSNSSRIKFGQFTTTVLTSMTVNGPSWDTQQEEEKVRRQAKETDNQGDIFDQVISRVDYRKCELTCCQVDMHVCADKAEWERIHFFHGYGDLGMILRLVAQNKGLALGRVEDLTQSLPSPHMLIVIYATDSAPLRPPFDLRENMEEITWAYLCAGCMAICGGDGFLTLSSGQTWLKVWMGGL